MERPILHIKKRYKIKIRENKNSHKNKRHRIYYEKTKNGDTRGSHDEIERGQIEEKDVRVTSGLLMIIDDEVKLAKR